MGRAVFLFVLMADTPVFAGRPGQILNPPARAVIAQSRSLTATEVAQILAAARDAIAGRTFKLSYQPSGPGPEVLMAANGRPRFVRTLSGYTSWSGASNNGTVTTSREYHSNVTQLTEFTGRPARRCDGSPIEGDLVVEYRNDTERGWIATARTRTHMEPGTPIFDMLTGAIAVESGSSGSRTIGGRAARAFVAPWKPPASPSTSAFAARRVSETLEMSVPQ